MMCEQVIEKTPIRQGEYAKNRHGVMWSSEEQARLQIYRNIMQQCKAEKKILLSVLGVKIQPLKY